MKNDEEKVAESSDFAEEVIGYYYDHYFSPLF